MSMSVQKPESSNLIKYTIYLEAGDNAFYLCSMQDDENIPFQNLVSQYKVLNVFNTLLEEEDGKLIVPLNKLKKVCNYLTMFSNGLLGSKVEIKVPADIENVISKESSNSKKMRTGEGLAEITIDDGSRGETVPIPIKPFNFLPAKAIKKENEYVTLKDFGYKVKRGVTNSNQEFLREAERLAEYEGAEAERIPFTCYYPTYEAMTEKQQKWYFWWRQCVRRQEYLETDLSYIFVYIYELINHIGIRDARDGYLKLVSVWHNYRKTYPKLDSYLSVWIHDYILVYSCEFTEQDAAALLSAEDLTNLSVDWIITYFKEKSFDQIPINLFLNLSDFPIKNSKFYAEGRCNELEEIFTVILPRIDVYFQATRRKGILSYFCSDKSSETKRLAFPGAIYASSGVKTINVSVSHYSSFDQLRKFITDIMKQTENKLREIHKIKGRLKGIEAEKELQQFIDGQLSAAVRKQKEAENKVKISVNQENITNLINDSDWVRDRLLEGIAEAFENTEPAVPAIKSVVENTSVKSYDSSTGNAANSIGQLDENTLKDLPEEWREFFNGLEEYQIETLKIISGGHGDRQEINKICDQYLMLPQMLMDMINNTALDTLGDLVIDMEAPEPVIYDEYKEMLCKLMR